MWMLCICKCTQFSPELSSSSVCFWSAYFGETRRPRTVMRTPSGSCGWQIASAWCSSRTRPRPSSTPTRIDFLARRWSILSSVKVREREREREFIFCWQDWDGYNTMWPFHLVISRLLRLSLSLYAFTSSLFVLPWPKNGHLVYA